MRFRYELINKLIETYNFKSYLEIGYQQGICFDSVNITSKTAVDPSPLRQGESSLLLMNSDDFFNQNQNKFDIIFIDGLHTYEQVKKDFDNSIKSLNNGGVIVLHDMNPSTEERAKSFNEGGVWNGDCFKLAIDFYNGEYGFEYHTIDMDQGCMVVYPSRKVEITKNNIQRDYKSFDSIRNEVLLLKSKEEFKNILENE